MGETSWQMAFSSWGELNFFPWGYFRIVTEKLAPSLINIGLWFYLWREILYSGENYLLDLLTIKAVPKHFSSNLECFQLRRSVPMEKLKIFQLALTLQHWDCISTSIPWSFSTGSLHWFVNLAWLVLLRVKSLCLPCSGMCASSLSLIQLSPSVAQQFSFSSSILWKHHSTMIQSWWIGKIHTFYHNDQQTVSPFCSPQILFVWNSSCYRASSYWRNYLQGS